MSQRLVSAERPPLRPDLMAEHLLHLSIFKLFVNPSSRSVAIRLNKRFKLRPKIKIKEVDAIYLYLHDIEHDMWLKAKSMNDGEGTQLRQFLSDCGLPPRVWSSVNRLRPVNPTACLRLPTASRTYRVRTHNHHNGGASTGNLDHTGRSTEDTGDRHVNEAQL